MKTTSSIYSRILLVLIALSLVAIAITVSYGKWEDYKRDLAQEKSERILKKLAAGKNFPNKGPIKTIGVKEAILKTKYISGEIYYNLELIADNSTKLLTPRPYSILLLDSEGFKLQELSLSPEESTFMDENGVRVGLTYNSSSSAEVEVYQSTTDWNLRWNE